MVSLSCDVMVLRILDSGGACPLAKIVHGKILAVPSENISSNTSLTSAAILCPGEILSRPVATSSSIQLGRLPPFSNLPCTDRGR